MEIPNRLANLLWISIYLTPLIHFAASSNGKVDRIFIIQMQSSTNKRLDSNCFRACFMPFFVFVIASIGNPVFAENYYFKHYSIEEGLAQSQVISIYQVSQRYLWLGTFGGVSRFSAIDFKNYTKMDGLNDEIVYSI